LLTFEKNFANNYLVKDEVIEANVDLYGGPSSQLIMLHSIKGVEPAKHGIEGDKDSLVAYMAEQVASDKKWPTVVVVQDSIVLFSTRGELQRGERIGSRLQQISSAEAAKFGFRRFLDGLKKLF
jgi:hypothetical protein